MTTTTTMTEERALIGTEREWNRFVQITTRNFKEFAGVPLRHAKQLLEECRKEYEEQRQ